jgi:hypothetical protein
MEVFTKEIDQKLASKHLLGGYLQSKEGGILNRLHEDVKITLSKHGFNLNLDYKLTDKSDRAYEPYISYKSMGENWDKLWLTYYNDGFELMGEIIIDLKKSISIFADFPSFVNGKQIENIAFHNVLKRYTNS